MSKPVLVSVCIVVIALTLLACGGQSAAPPAAGGEPTTASDEADLVGTWIMEDQDGRYVFKADHTGELELGSIHKTFTYTTDAGVVTLVIDGEADTVGGRPMRFAVTDDVLELSVEGQPEPSRFTRQ